MKNEVFLKASYEQKVNELVLRTKEVIQKGGKVEPYFFLFDKNNRLHVAEIKERSLFKIGREDILKSIVKEKIDMIKSKGIQINKVLHMREVLFDRTVLEDNNNIDLINSNHKLKGEPALIVTIEDAFDFEIQVYDVIRIEDEGKTFSVISKDPIYQRQVSKLDPEVDIKTKFKNMI